MAVAQVVDSAVLRFPKAVTHFSPGSYTSRPTQVTSLPNVFMAGDWVRGLQHGANGLSQVRGSSLLPGGGRSHPSPACSPHVHTSFTVPPCTCSASTNAWWTVGGIRTQMGVECELPLNV